MNALTLAGGGTVASSRSRQPALEFEEIYPYKRDNRERGFEI